MPSKRNQRNLWRRYINIKLTIVALLALCLVACGSNPVKSVAKTPDKNSDETIVVKQDYKVSASIQQQYKYALEAMQAENYAEAISMFDQIIKKEPRASGPWVNKAIAYRNLQELDKAGEAIETAVKLNPSNPYALNQAGIIKREQGEFESAHEMYKRALAEYPNYANAHLNLAILCDLYLQKMVCAKSHYQAYQEINKKDDKNVVAWINDISRRENQAK